MADFCKACSIVHFGTDFEELAGISTEENTREERYALVICEGCGPIQVDHTGRCVSDDCLCKGQAGHGLNNTEMPEETETDDDDPEWDEPEGTEGTPPPSETPPS